jgi:hypothetical protein
LHIAQSQREHSLHIAQAHSLMSGSGWHIHCCVEVTVSELSTNKKPVSHCGERVVGVLTQGGTEAQEPAVCTARSRLNCLQLALHAQRDPLRDEIRQVGRGLSLAVTQTGRYGRLYSRRRLCTRRGALDRLLLRILLELVQPLATLASPRAKYLIPIPVPVQYRLSRCLE